MMSELTEKILEGRGLDLELLAKFGVTTFERNGSNWIKFPYLVDGVVVNNKYRTITGEKKFHQDADAKKSFWNFDVLKDQTLKNEPVIITEGEFDAIAAIQCGFSRVVSVPDGAPAQANAGDLKYSYLAEAAGLLIDVKEIIIASDGDGPGANLLHDLSHRLGRQRCKFVKYPKDCKDLNDALKLYGHRGVVETIARASWVHVEGVYRLDDLPPAPDTKTYNIGMIGLDDHYKIRLGDFTVITGIPGHGKSTFVNDLCCRMVERHGWNVAFASFEQNPRTDHVRNFKRWYICGHPNNWTQEQERDAEKWINKNFCFLVPSEDENVNLEWVLEKASTAVIRNGSKIVVIDPWNEMDHERPPDMSITEYTGFAIKEFKRFAKKHNIHLIVVAHPSKAVKQHGEKARMPDLYDISDSAHWYNKADVGIIVHRDEFGSKIRVQKTRYHDIIGKPGQVDAKFNYLTNRFEVDPLWKQETMDY